MHKKLDVQIVTAASIPDLIQKYPTVGMSVTIFYPNLDIDNRVAKQIVTIISNVLS